MRKPPYYITGEKERHSSKGAAILHACNDVRWERLQDERGEHVSPGREIHQQYYVAARKRKYRRWITRERDGNYYVIEPYDLKGRRYSFAGRDVYGVRSPRNAVLVVESKVRRGKRVTTVQGFGTHRRYEREGECGE